LISGQDQALAGAAPSRPGRLHGPVVNRKQRPSRRNPVHQLKLLRAA
jgi:hypothetical protein